MTIILIEPRRHHASISDPKAIDNLLRIVNGYKGFFATKCALKLVPLIFVRPGELRKAEWSDVNLETAELTENNDENKNKTYT